MANAAFPINPEEMYGAQNQQGNMGYSQNNMGHQQNNMAAPERGYMPAGLPEDLVPGAPRGRFMPEMQMRTPVVNEDYYTYNDQNFQAPQDYNDYDDYADEYDIEYQEPVRQPQRQQRQRRQPISQAERLYGAAPAKPEMPASFVQAAVEHFAPELENVLAPLVNVDDPEAGKKNRVLLGQATKTIANMMGVVGETAMNSVMQAVQPLYAELEKARNVNAMMLDPDGRVAMDLMQNADMRDPEEAIKVARFMRRNYEEQNPPQRQMRQGYPQQNQVMQQGPIVGNVPRRQPPYRIPNTGTRGGSMNVTPNQMRAARGLGVNPSIYTNPFFADGLE